MCADDVLLIGLSAADVNGFPAIPCFAITAVVALVVGIVVLEAAIDAIDVVVDVVVDAIDVVVDAMLPLPCAIPSTEDLTECTARDVVVGASGGFAGADRGFC